MNTVSINPAMLAEILRKKRAGEKLSMTQMMLLKVAEALEAKGVLEVKAPVVVPTQPPPAPEPAVSAPASPATEPAVESPFAIQPATVPAGINPLIWVGAGVVLLLPVLMMLLKKKKTP